MKVYLNIQGVASVLGILFHTRNFALHTIVERRCDYYPGVVPPQDQVVVFPVFDFIRLDTKAHFTIFGVNVSWDWWVNNGKRVISFQDTFEFFVFLVRLRFRTEKNARLDGLIT